MEVEVQSTAPTETTAPAPAEQAESSAAGAAEPDRRELLKAHLKKMREELKAKTEGVQVVEGDAENTTNEQAEGTESADKQTADAESTDDDDSAVSLDLAKAKRRLADVQDEMRATREELKSLKGQVQSYESKFAAVKDDPAAALAAFPEIFGKDYGAFVKWVVENEDKVTAKRKYADLPPDVREEIEASRRDREERKARETREQQERAVTEYAGKVSTYLTENAEEYPLAASLGWAALQLAEQHGVGKVRPEHIRAFEKTLTENLVAALSDERVVKHLLSSNETVRDMVATAVSVGQKPNKSPAAASSKTGNPAPKDGPRSLTNTTATAEVAPAEQDRRALLVAEIRKLRAQSQAH